GEGRGRIRYLRAESGTILPESQASYNCHYSAPVQTLPAFADLRRGRLFLHKRHERFVTVAFHSFDWNEMEGGRVNGVTLSGGRLRFGKEMAKVGVTSFGAHLGALHIVRTVQALRDEIFRALFAKRGQAEAAIEFVGRSKQMFAGNDIDIDAGARVIRELVWTRRLGATLPHDEIFLGL